MSQRLVRRAGIAGITVAGLLLAGSSVASATELPVPASGSPTISITTTAHAGCPFRATSGRCYCPTRYVPKAWPREPYAVVEIRDFCRTSSVETSLGHWGVPVHPAPGDPVPESGDSKMLEDRPYDSR